jgi:DNA-binding response OmpR family regulator
MGTKIMTTTIQTSNENLKIALIEDDPIFVFVLRAKLGEHCEHFLEVSEFDDVGYNVIISDLGLKETLGFETITALRSKTTAPIVVLTGMGGRLLAATDMAPLLKAGATNVFSKDILQDPSFPNLVDRIAHGEPIY